jgi:hypothetical protein
LEVLLDSARGCLTGLKDLESGQIWSNGDHPLGVMSYQSFSAADYDRFVHQYIIPEEQKSDWPKEDFGKPGVELANPGSRVWNTVLTQAYQRQVGSETSVLYHMTFAKAVVSKYGAPQEVFVLYRFPEEKKQISIEVQWFKKQASRLPEAIWLGFVPLLPAGAHWKIEKLGKWVSPSDVVENGNRHLHATGKGVELSHPNGKLRLVPLDSTLVAPGAPSMLDFNNDQPDPYKGMHFCLLDNLWGTNFPMWFEEDCRFRFDLLL